VIVQPPCTVIKSIPLRPYASAVGVAYDPVTRQVVVTDEGNGIAYVLQRTSIVKTVSLGGESRCPYTEAWDPSLGAILVSDVCGGGVDVMRLSLVHGVTESRVHLNDFDASNYATGLLVADGYVFSAGRVVNVYDAATLRFVGAFPVVSTGDGTDLCTCVNVAWDSLNHTVVYTDPGAYPTRILFLNADSIATHQFTFSRLHARYMAGAGAVGYSPMTRDAYTGAAFGNNVYAMNSTGSLHRVYLGENAQPYEMTLDPLNGAMYVTGSGTGSLYEIE